MASSHEHAASKRGNVRQPAPDGRMGPEGASKDRE